MSVSDLHCSAAVYLVPDKSYEERWYWVDQKMSLWQHYTALYSALSVTLTPRQGELCFTPLAAPHIALSKHQRDSWTLLYNTAALKLIDKPLMIKMFCILHLLRPLRQFIMLFSMQPWQCNYCLNPPGTTKTTQMASIYMQKLWLTSQFQPYGLQIDMMLVLWRTLSL